MAMETLDCIGLKCPHPTLQVALLAVRLKPGDIIDVTADCATFEKDLKDWAARTKKTILWVKALDGPKKQAQIKL
jgi:tRNA 2-thiouridine synthesizing protein A